MADLLNKKATRQFILGQIEHLRPFLKVSRVSKQALDQYEGRIRAMILADIKTHPTFGKTFKLY